MKKGIAILILIVLTATGVFAQGFSVSAGGGGLFDWNFNNGVQGKWGSNIEYEGYRNMSFGGFVFVDFTYAELNLGFTYGLLTFVREQTGKSPAGKPMGTMLAPGASLLLKIPLNFGKMTLFPLLGAGYYAVIIAKDDDGNDISDSLTDTLKELSQICILGGAGFDMFLAGSLFMRVEALYQVRLSSKTIVDSADANTDPDAMPTIGRGPQVKIGVGYRF